MWAQLFCLRRVADGGAFVDLVFKPWGFMKGGNSETSRDSTSSRTTLLPIIIAFRKAPARYTAAVLSLPLRHTGLMWRHKRQRQQFQSPDRNVTWLEDNTCRRFSDIHVNGTITYNSHHPTNRPQVLKGALHTQKHTASWLKPHRPNFAVCRYTVLVSARTETILGDFSWYYSVRPNAD
jgi:hypothetical protein